MTGTELKEKRKREGLSQFLLAHYAGVHYRELCLFEKGEGDLPIQAVAQLAAGLIELPALPYRQVILMEREARQKFNLPTKQAAQLAGVGA